MSCCCLCGDTIEANLAKNLITEQHLKALIKNLLILTDLESKIDRHNCERLCILCEEDVEILRKFLLRIKNCSIAANVLPEPETTDPELSKHVNVTSNNSATKETGFVNETKAVEYRFETTDQSNPRKRLRRPPKRYRDEDCMSSKPSENCVQVVKIYKFPQKLDGSSFNCHPKMAYIRSSIGAIVGDLVEVQHRGKHSRMRMLCRQCSQAFTHEKRFRQHLAKHQEENGKQVTADSERFSYLCVLCEKPFQEHFVVRRHFKTSHTEERSFKCGKCPAAFKYKTNLDYHMAKHLDHKTHQCPHCNKKFVLRYELQIHLRIHTGQKPFKCQICSLGFAHRSNLQKHRLTHRQQMPKVVKCRQCSAAFTNRINLMRHKEDQHKMDEDKKPESNRSEQEVEDNLKTLNIKEILSLATNNLPSSENQQHFGSSAILPTPEHTLETPININEDRSKINLTTKVTTSCITSKANLLNIYANETIDFNVPQSAMSSKPILADIENVQISEISQMPEHIGVNSILPFTSNNRHTVSNSPKLPVTTLLPKNFKIVKIPKIITSQTKQYNSKPFITTLQSDWNSAKTQIKPTRLGHESKAINSQILNQTLNITPISKAVGKCGTFVSDKNSLQSTTQELQTNVQTTCSSTSVRFQQPMTNADNSYKFLHITADDDFSSKNEQNKTSEGLNVLDNLKCNNIIHNLSTDIQLKGSNNTPNSGDVVLWKHFEVSPIITNINANDEIIYTQTKRLEKPEATVQKTLNNASNTIQKMDNAFCAKPSMQMLTTCNTRSTVIPSSPASLDSKPKYSSALTLRKTPVKLNISPRSLLKPQVNKTIQPVKTIQTATNQSPPTKHPLVTNVEILPQINIQHIQTAAPASTQGQPLQSTKPYVIKIPAEYKFQCSKCWKYFKQRSSLNKHMRTHTGEKPYKCNFCPKSYADASNFKKHKMLHTRAADALNIKRPKPAPPPSPPLSTISDPDPDGIEVMQTIQPFELSSSDDSDEMESYVWQNALQHSLMNEEIRENIKRNLMAINSAIMPSEMLNVSEITRNCGDTLSYFSSENPD